MDIRRKAEDESSENGERRNWRDEGEKNDREDENREQMDPKGEHAIMVDGSYCKDVSAIAWIVCDRVVRQTANEGAPLQLCTDQGHVPRC